MPLFYLFENVATRQYERFTREVIALIQESRIILVIQFHFLLIANSYHRGEILSCPERLPVSYRIN